jgi:hypothetical protein
MPSRLHACEQKCLLFGLLMMQSLDGRLYNTMQLLGLHHIIITISSSAHNRRIALLHTRASSMRSSPCKLNVVETRRGCSDVGIASNKAYRCVARQHIFQTVEPVHLTVAVAETISRGFLMRQVIRGMIALPRRMKQLMAFIGRSQGGSLYDFEHLLM